VNDCAFEVKDRYGNNPDISVLAWLSQAVVMWNSFVTGVCSGPAGQGCPLGAGILINSPRGWYTPSTMGSLDTGGMVNVYFEDCTFMNSGGFDVDDRGRLVVRRCLLDGTSGLPTGSPPPGAGATLSITTTRSGVPRMSATLRGATSGAARGPG